MPSNHLILYHPLLLLPSIFPSITVFSKELALRIRWPKYWSFSISTSNEHSGLVSFRIGWFDLLAVQGIVKSVLQHYSLTSSVLCNHVDYSTPGSSVLHYLSGLLKFMSIEPVRLSNHLILCRLLLLLPSIFPSIRIFSNESALHIRWPKYWSFSFSSVLPMNI